MNKYQYKVKGVDYEVEIAEVEGNIAKVNVNGIPFEVELQKPINAAKHPTMNTPKVQVAQPAAAPAAPKTAPATESAAPASQPAAGAGTAVKAPLPGTVTEIKVQVGQQVNVGDTVLVLEAMKMQNNIEAEAAGKVTSILVKQGESVMEGSVLLTIA
jgi:biotin carboxyl carrier protein